MGKALKVRDSRDQSASDIVERLREAKSGAMFINNTGDRAWQRWMLDLLNDALDAAAEIERLRKDLLLAEANAAYLRSGGEKPCPYCDLRKPWQEGACPRHRGKSVNPDNDTLSGNPDSDLRAAFQKASDDADQYHADLEEALAALRRVYESGRPALTYAEHDGIRALLSKEKAGETPDEEWRERFGQAGTPAPTRCHGDAR